MIAVVPPGSLAHTWAVSTTDGHTVRGHLPAWATDDPSKPGVAPWRLAAELADITHHKDMGGLILPVSRGQDVVEATVVMAVTMEIKPFPEVGEPNIPTVHVQIADDLWLKDLDPNAVAEFGARLRGLADRLITTVAPALTAARVGWARHHAAPLRPR